MSDAGYIFVTHKQMGRGVSGGGMGYIFVTRDLGMLLGCGRGCIEWVLFVVGQCKIHAHKLDYYVIISYICSV